MAAIDTPQPFTDHLEEIRRRLINLFIFFIIAGLACYHFVDPVIDWLARPVGHLIFTSPTEAFFVRVKLAFGLGTFLIFPLFLYHIYKFVGVALKDRERSVIVTIIPFSLLLFLCGASLALFVVMPIALKFLVNFGSATLVPMISVGAYLSFLFWMMVGFGVLFQLPLVVVALCRLGIVHPATLAGYRRHVFIGVLIVAAVLTPGPDIFSQLVLTIPSYVLFELSLLLVKHWK